MRSPPAWVCIYGCCRYEDVLRHDSETHAVYTTSNDRLDIGPEFAVKCSNLVLSAPRTCALWFATGWT